MNHQDKITCHICGNKKLEERVGYEICPICFWEDEMIAQLCFWENDIPVHKLA